MHEVSQYLHPHQQYLRQGSLWMLSLPHLRYMRSLLLRANFGGGHLQGGFQLSKLHGSLSALLLRLQTAGESLHRLGWELQVIRRPNWGLLNLQGGLRSDRLPMRFWDVLQPQLRILQRDRRVLHLQAGICPHWRQLLWQEIT
jgi:hypothetical protein